jgi:hypothetical protein
MNVGSWRWGNKEPGCEFTYDRQFADLWVLVAFAEKDHPELDLLTPPKRPTK